MQFLTDANSLILALVNGAIFIMVAYHSIVYGYHRPVLLKQYVIYLWLVWIYCFYRLVILVPGTGVAVDNFVIALDEVFQMFAFVQYVRFLGVAMQVDVKKSTPEALFVKYTPWVIFTYLLVLTIVSSVLKMEGLYLALKILIRLFLLVGGFAVLMMVLRQKHDLYYRMIGAGTLSLIIFGLLSALSKFVDPQHLPLSPLSFLLIGFLIDVIFFSSAVGYTIKQEADMKEEAFKVILQKEQELAAKQLETIKLVYETKKIERQRIANDLHDDLGGTMSSLLIYGSIARKTMNEEPEYAAQMMDKLIVQSQQAMDNLSDIVWSMKFTKGLNSLSERVKNYGTELLQDLDIAIHYDIDPKVDSMLSKTLDRKNVLLFTKEALNNIAKYSSATEAWVRMKVRDEVMKIEIGDNGHGFDMDTATNGNGLETMKNRMVELNGEAIITSALGKGTSIVASFSLKQDI